MTEKILNKRPNGMAALIGFSLLYIVAIAVTIFVIFCYIFFVFKRNEKDKRLPGQPR